jgi:pentapeptide repeat protein/ion channel
VQVSEQAREAMSPGSLAPVVSPSQEMGGKLDRDAIVRLRAAQVTKPLDLGGRDLRGADLRAMDLAAANLAGADLRGTALDGAHLGGADLTAAQLDGARLEGADLRHARLTGASLRQAELSGAHLEQALLHGAHLEGAHLPHARLDGARLRDAHFEGATLWGASLRGAELDGGHFSGADLHDVDLDGAFFAGSTLADADLALARWGDHGAGEELAARRAPLAERAEQYLVAADAYRRLRQACSAQGLYGRAGELYRSEMRMRQAAYASEFARGLSAVPVLGAIPRAIFGYLAARGARRAAANPSETRPAALSTLLDAPGRAWRAVVGPLARWLWHAALEVLCGHGERVGRVLVAGLVVIIGMALVYLRLGQLTEGNGTVVTSYWHALYFSACSFTSIGYAAFSPGAVGVAKWLGVAESFTGNFLLALFLVTFTRKLTR